MSCVWYKHSISSTLLSASLYIIYNVFSLCSGFMNLARSGSVKLRNSFRRHGSIHKREENTVTKDNVSVCVQTLCDLCDVCPYRRTIVIRFEKEDHFSML